MELKHNDGEPVMAGDGGYSLGTREGYLKAVAERNKSLSETRINNLAILAGGEWRGGYVEQPNGDLVYTDKKWVDICDADALVFARLVARECVELVLAYDDIPMAVEMADMFGVEK